MCLRGEHSQLLKVTMALGYGPWKTAAKSTHKKGDLHVRPTIQLRALEI